MPDEANWKDNMITKEQMTKMLVDITQHLSECDNYLQRTQEYYTNGSIQKCATKLEDIQNLIQNFVKDIEKDKWQSSSLDILVRQCG